MVALAETPGRGNAPTRNRQSVRFARRMQAVAGMFSLIAVTLVAAPALVMSSLDMPVAPVGAALVMQCGALIGGFAFLAWRARQVVAARAQRAITAGIFAALVLSGTMNGIAVAKGAFPTVMLTVAGLQFLFAIWMVYGLRKP